MVVVRGSNGKCRMKEARDRWAGMLRQLAAFKHRHGHCRVPTRCPENPPLGHWGAVQRHRRKIGELSSAKVRHLDHMGFTWALSDGKWARMCHALAAFKKKHGH